MESWGQAPAQTQFHQAASSCGQAQLVLFLLAIIFAMVKTAHQICVIGLWLAQAILMLLVTQAVLHPMWLVQAAQTCRCTMRLRTSRRLEMSDIDLVKYGVLWQKVESMEAKIDKMEAQLETLVELANKGRGGFWMGMIFISAVSSVAGYFANWFHK